MARTKHQSRKGKKTKAAKSANDSGKKDSKKAIKAKSSIRKARGPTDTPLSLSNIGAAARASPSSSTSQAAKEKKKRQLDYKNARKKKQESKGATQKKGKQRNLLMPIVGPDAPPVPWLPSQPSAQIKAHVGSTWYNILEKVPVKQAALEALTRELLHFAKYVQLTSVERRARIFYIYAVQQASKSLFRCNKDDVKLFGSFGAQAVCTFESDVDLAIWNVVPVEQEPTATSSSNAEMKRTAEEPAAEARNPPLQPHPNSRKQERILKWKEALDELDQQMAEQRSKQQSDSLENDSSANIDIPNPSIVTDTSTDAEKPKSLPGSNATLDSEDKSTDDDMSTDSADKLDRLDERKRAATTGVDADRIALLNMPDPEDVPKRSKECKQTYVATRPRSQSHISLCSATTASDTEFDESGMEVSFVTSPSRGKSKNQVAELSGEIRTKVVKSLFRLSKCLRRSPYTMKSHVRRDAKVPIVNLETSLGYECDIALGGHNGMDTSAFATTQCDRFVSFAPVVLFLKVLLAQGNFDKTFTGGLGSFRLYILVTHHIEYHLALGGRDDPGEILFMFLVRFGGINRGTCKHLPEEAWTELKQHQNVHTLDGEGEAEMGSVSKAPKLESLWRLCGDRLAKRLRQDSHQNGFSLLRFLVDARILKEEREARHQKASGFVGTFASGRTMNELEKELLGDVVSNEASGIFSSPICSGLTARKKRPRRDPEPGQEKKHKLGGGENEESFVSQPTVEPLNISHTLVEEPDNGDGNVDNDSTWPQPEEESDKATGLNVEEAQIDSPAKTYPGLGQQVESNKARRRSMDVDSLPSGSKTSNDVILERSEQRDKDKGDTLDGTSAKASKKAKRKKEKASKDAERKKERAALKAERKKEKKRKRDKSSPEKEGSNERGISGEMTATTSLTSVARRFAGVPGLDSAFNPPSTLKSN